MKRSNSKLVFFLIVILTLLSLKAVAQDLGPVGPKSGSSSSSGGSSKPSVNLPYIPQTEEKISVKKKGKSSQVSSQETSTAEEPKAIVPPTPDIAPKYPTPMGAPDMGI